MAKNITLKYKNIGLETGFKQLKQELKDQRDIGLFVDWISLPTTLDLVSQEPIPIGKILDEALAIYHGLALFPTNIKIRKYHQSHNSNSSTYRASILIETIEETEASRILHKHLESPPNLSFLNLSE
jgi:hypothetical protein